MLAIRSEAARFDRLESIQEAYEEIITRYNELSGRYDELRIAFEELSKFVHAPDEDDHHEVDDIADKVDHNATALSIVWSKVDDVERQITQGMTTLPEGIINMKYIQNIETVDIGDHLALVPDWLTGSIVGNSVDDKFRVVGSFREAHLAFRVSATGEMKRPSGEGVVVLPMAEHVDMLAQVLVADTVAFQHVLTQHTKLTPDDISLTGRFRVQMGDLVYEDINVTEEDLVSTDLGGISFALSGTIEDSSTRWDHAINGLIREHLPEAYSMMNTSFWEGLEITDDLDDRFTTYGGVPLAIRIKANDKIIHDDIADVGYVASGEISVLVPVNVLDAADLTRSAYNPTALITSEVAAIEELLEQVRARQEQIVTSMTNHDLAQDAMQVGFLLMLVHGAFAGKEIESALGRKLLDSVSTVAQGTLMLSTIYQMVQHPTPQLGIVLASTAGISFAMAYKEVLSTLRASQIAENLEVYLTGDSSLMELAKARIARMSNSEVLSWVRRVPGSGVVMRNIQRITNTTGETTFGRTMTRLRVAVDSIWNPVPTRGDIEQGWMYMRTGVNGGTPYTEQISPDGIVQRYQLASGDTLEVQHYESKEDEHSIFEGGHMSLIDQKTLETMIPRMDGFGASGEEMIGSIRRGYVDPVTGARGGAGGPVSEPTIGWADEGGGLDLQRDMIESDKTQSKYYASEAFMSALDDADFTPSSEQGYLGGFVERGIDVGKRLFRVAEEVEDGVKTIRNIVGSERVVKLKARTKPDPTIPSPSSPEDMQAPEFLDYIRKQELKYFPWKQAPIRDLETMNEGQLWTYLERYMLHGNVAGTEATLRALNIDGIVGGPFS